MADGDWAAIISAGASALSAGFAAYAVFQVRRQVASGERATIVADRAREASVFLEISKSWNEIYPKYRQLLATPPNIDAIMKTHTQFDEYAATQEWAEMRQVFAFYEFLGAVVRRKLLEEHTLFSFVYVNVALWDRFKPLIMHFRNSSSRQDLYTAWEFLVERRRCYPPGFEHEPLAAAR
jgi:Domain of unknown function (DUF4760)